MAFVASARDAALGWDDTHLASRNSCDSDALHASPDRWKGSPPAHYICSNTGRPSIENSGDLGGEGGWIGRRNTGRCCVVGRDETLCDASLSVVTEIRCKTATEMRKKRKGWRPGACRKVDELKLPDAAVIAVE